MSQGCPHLALCNRFFVLYAVISLHTRHGMTMGSPGMERP